MEQSTTIYKEPYYSTLRKEKPLET